MIDYKNTKTNICFVYEDKTELFLIDKAFLTQSKDHWLFYCGCSTQY